MNRLLVSLPFILGLIGGSTDTIGFLGLNGLFTAHITGNLVVLASRVIAGDSAVLSQIMAVPVFILVSLLAALYASRLQDQGPETQMRHLRFPCQNRRPGRLGVSRRAGGEHTL